MDIRDFVEARVADDERAARQTDEDGGSDLEYEHRYGRLAVSTARLLRGVEATRKLLAEVDGFGHYYCEDPWYSCPLNPEGCANDSINDEVCNCGLEERQFRVLRLLAFPYSGHPDWDERWAA